MEKAKYIYIYICIYLSSSLNSRGKNAEREREHNYYIAPSHHSYRTCWQIYIGGKKQDKLSHPDGIAHL
jgi:hypothetical protein